MGGRDTWLVSVIFFLYGLFFLALMLSRRLVPTGYGLAGLARLRLGMVGIALVLLAIIYLLTTLIVHVQDFTDFFKNVMPETPSFIFSGVLILITTIALCYGIEVLGRVALLLLPVVILFILSGILANLPSFEPGYLLPFIENGWVPLFKASFLQMSYTSELLALGFLAGFIGCGSGMARRSSFIGLLIAVILFLLISVFLIGVMGEGYTVNSNFKLFNLFQYGLRRSATGVESLFVVVWISVFFVKAAILQGAVGIALNEIKPLNPKIYFITAGIATYTVTFFVFSNRIELLHFYSVIYPPVALSFTLLFLILLYMFSGKDVQQGQ